MSLENLMPDHLTNRRRKEIASLRQKKYRDELAEMLVEGKRSVEAALNAAAPLKDIVVAHSVATTPDIRQITDRATVPVYVVPDADIEGFSAVETSQGILAVVTIDADASLDLRATSMILALDGLQDPGNVGTLIRTAAWFGIDAVATAPGTVDMYHPKVVRAAMGALWDLRRARLDDLPAWLAECKREGFGVYGADLHGIDVRDWRPAGKSVLVLGSESHGISPVVAALLDERIVVRGGGQRRGTESLNVAVAAGILMYAWVS
jgi:TrmH family RNA methyltransferase